MDKVKFWAEVAWAWVSSDARRRRLYQFGIGFFGVLATFGIITADQSTEWTTILERVFGFLTALMALLHWTPDADEDQDDVASEDDPSDAEDASATAE